MLKKKHPKTYPFAGRNKNFLTFLETFEIASSMIKIAQDNEKINLKGGNREIIRNVPPQIVFFLQKMRQ